MEWWRVGRWFGKSKSREQRELELDQELSAHLELEAEEQRESGATPEAAPYCAMRALGNTALIKEDVRQAWGWTPLERLAQDVRYSLRSLRRSPGFAVVVVLSLAIGIGATTSVFTVYRAAFLRSLPVRNPRELRILNWTGGERTPAVNVSGYIYPENGVTRCGSFSFEAYQAIRKNVAAFASVAGFSQIRTNVRGPSQAESADAQLVSANFLDTVGVQPVIGRTFAAQEDSLSAQPVVVLSWRAWHRLYAGNPRAVGMTLMVEGVAYTVIGILPPRFAGLSPTSAVDVYLPLARAAQFGKYYTFDDPSTWWIEAIGRLAPGSDDRQARAQLDVVLRQVATAHASRSKREVESPKSLLVDGRTGLASRNTTISQTLLALFAMVGLALFVTCANVANLSLARGAARTRERAVRLALGAGRFRIVRLVLVESFVLAMAGGITGFWLARLGTAALAGMLWPGGNAAVDLGPDAAVLGFTTALSLATAILFGIVPALRSTRALPASCLRQGGAGAALVRQRLAKSLVVVQVAIAFVLVFGAGLFARTLVNLGRVDLGFRADGLLLFYVDPSRNGYKEQRLLDVSRRLQERVAAIPGVSQVTFSRNALITGWMSTRSIAVPGYTPKPGERIRNMNNIVGDDFFNVMGMPIVLGRPFSPSDNKASAKVAVVNRALAKRYFSGNPIGREFIFGTRAGDESIRIVGVVADAKYYDVRADAEPTVYLPYTQNAQSLSGMTFAVRTSAEPLSLSNAVRRAVAGVDPTLPASGFRTQQEQIERTISRERTFAFLASFLSAITLALSCIGIYGILAYAVARRTSEFGVRMALGATSWSVCWQVMRGSLLLVSVGIAIGVPAALGAVKLISERLFGVEPADPATMAAATAAMVLAAGLGAWIPARRAAALNPVVALRNE